MRTCIQSQSCFALLMVSFLFLTGCGSGQQTEKPDFWESIKPIVQRAGLAAERVNDPRAFHREREREEELRRYDQMRQDNEYLRQAILSRIADSDRPLTQEDIALFQYYQNQQYQLQNQQYQQQHINHLQRMEEMKKQEIENQKFESMRRRMQEGRIYHVRPDGRGGYTIY